MNEDQEFEQRRHDAQQQANRDLIDALKEEGQKVGIDEHVAGTIVGILNRQNAIGELGGGEQLKEDFPILEKYNDQIKAAFAKLGLSE